MNLRKRFAEWICPDVVLENILSRGLDRAFVATKVDGKERVVSVSELIRCYQKNAAADNRMREAAEVLKAAKRAAKDAPKYDECNVQMAADWLHLHFQLNTPEQRPGA
jgi:hypothetical protein